MDDPIGFEDADPAEYPGIDVALQRAGLHPLEQGRVFEFLINRGYTILAIGTAIAGISIPTGLATIDGELSSSMVLALTSLLPAAVFLVFIAVSMATVRIGLIELATGPGFSRRNFAAYEPPLAKLNLLGHLEKKGLANSEVLEDRRKWLRYQLFLFVGLAVTAIGWAITVASISFAAG